MRIYVPIVDWNYLRYATPRFSFLKQHVQSIRSNYICCLFFFSMVDLHRMDWAYVIFLETKIHASTTCVWYDVRRPCMTLFCFCLFYFFSFFVFLEC
ncbi:hypothetical protein PgNI_05677, partial [Pyricularia grisea]|uniref:Uncharacterized protein n=1 Tax=Pyricularia grisea TaxID=148305 RepID=A0A6P8B3W5_PYRGI